ncbi:MAG: V-type ATP synthase subunit K [Clostridia bacterium]
MLLNLLAFFETLDAATTPLQLGPALAFLAMAVAFIPAGIGSAMAVCRSGQTAAGISAEKPELYSKLQIIMLLPATQGLYGFIVAFLIGLKINIFGAIVPLTVEQGLSYLFAALPVALVGFLSAIYQAKMASSACIMVSKNPSMSGKGILMVAAIELYAIFGLLTSFLIVWFGVAV